MTKCKALNCERIDLEAKGLCQSHYWRFNRYGDENATSVPVKLQCIILGCHNPKKNKSGDYCEKHYRHKLAHGDALAGKFHGPPGSHSLNKDGYVRIYLPEHPNSSYGSVFEHTLIMSQMINRPLLKGESVHHKNGIRHDNRPENLELWTTRSHQPKGQRVQDMVQWARELLVEYGELFPEEVSCDDRL